MEDEKGVNGMCKALEDMRREVAEETAEQMRVDHAIKLIKNGKLSFDEIAEAVDFLHFIEWEINRLSNLIK